MNNRLSFKGKSMASDITVPDTFAEQGAAGKQTTRPQSIREMKRHTSLCQLPSRQRDHGASKPLN